MKKTIFCCDRCGEEIQDMVYTLTCYAEPVPSADPVKNIVAQFTQNMRQNSLLTTENGRHLCRKCKDELTDGVFIL